MHVGATEIDPLHNPTTALLQNSMSTSPDYPVESALAKHRCLSRPAMGLVTSDKEVVWLVIPFCYIISNWFTLFFPLKGTVTMRHIEHTSKDGRSESTSKENTVWKARYIIRIYTVH